MPVQRQHQRVPCESRVPFFYFGWERPFTIYYVVGEGGSQKLYVKVSCSICLGGRRKGVFLNCPYCDLDRKTMVEASPSVIQNYLSSLLSNKEKRDLIKVLKEQLDETSI